VSGSAGSTTSTTRAPRRAALALGLLAAAAARADLVVLTDGGTLKVASYAVEGDLPLPALAGADEAFLSSTTREVQPIRAVDGKVLPSVPGPLTVAASEAFNSLVARDLDP